MAKGSKIEWTNDTWNPVTGCSKVSPGCKNCYAEAMWPRFNGKQVVIVPTPADGCVPQDFIKPETVTGHWTRPRRFTDVQCHPDRLWKNSPGTWKKPRMVFVNSMSDLFHEDVPFDFIDEVFEVINVSPMHTFQILTKRPARMLEYFNRKDAWMAGMDHVWLGVSVENQETADERIPLLLKTPAAVRFLSMEPLLSRVDLTRLGQRHDLGGKNQAWCLDSLRGSYTDIDVSGEKRNRIDWVIVGGESGKNARPMHPEWVRSLRDQCNRAGVPFFFKQWGAWVPRSACYHKFADGKSCADYDPEATKWPCIRLTEGGHNGRNLAHVDSGCDAYMQRVGKKAAGRLLDGVLHDGFPGGVA